MHAGPLKILAIDDEQLLLAALERACRQRALDLCTALTAEEALTAIDNGRYDLFLLDFDLKDPHCRMLLEIIDQRCPYVPVILMTTSSRNSSTLVEAIRCCRTQGSWHLLEKPFSLERMIHCINEIHGDREQKSRLFDPETHHYEHEKRRHTRHPHVQPVSFTYQRIVEGATKQYSSRGILTDISEDGTGMLTHESLQPGLIIRFCGKFSEKLGRVAWNTRVEAETYRCGLEFC